jgi:hypothetical protein
MEKPHKTQMYTDNADVCKDKTDELAYLKNKNIWASKLAQNNDRNIFD